MPRRRKTITLRVKLASALLELTRLRMMGPEANQFYEDSKLMTADQIISLFHFDHHPIAHANGGPDEPWNLTPLMLRQHRTKTAKRDLKEMARDRHIEGKWRDFHRAVAKGRKPPKRSEGRWPKRPLGKIGMAGRAR